MKPQVQKRIVESSNYEYIQLGVPEVWIDPLKKLGYTNISKLRETEKPGKLANDLNGFNKKNKLGLPGLSPEMVSSWIS